LNQYDQVTYRGGAFPLTHPAHLAALGSLRGIRPPGPAGCRVLELGCGDGANLVPMAYSMPFAELTGVDLSARAIERPARLRAPWV
jgi:methylase of polypeptide subunit release factors